MKKLISLAALLALSTAAANVLAAGNAAAGKAKSAVCAGCHGIEGNSAAPNFPKLAGLNAGYLAKQLADFKSGARKDPIMSGMAAPLSKQDMDNLGAYYAGQKRSPGTASLTEATAKLAQNLYRGGTATMGGVPACMGCHGPAGAGVPPQFPAVSGQHAAYTAKQLADFRSGARTNDGNVMAPIAAKLSDAEAKALSEYMAGLH
jgi:cytochrome c553